MELEYSDDRFLSFVIGKENFAIPLMLVREVSAFPNMTPLPNAAPHFLGFMSLRQEVIPVLDLRIKMGIEPSLSHDTGIIICQINNYQLGIVVDLIHNVIAPLKSEIMAIHQEGFQLNGGFVKSIIKKEKELIVVLNLEEVLSSEDQVIINKKKEKDLTSESGLSSDPEAS